MSSTMTTTATPTGTITRGELADLLRDGRGATFATLTVRTAKKLLKKHRETGEPQPCPEAFKLSRVNVCIGHDYEASVNRSLARRGEDADFEAQALSTWQEHAGGPLRRHKTKDTLYVAVKVERVYSTAYVDAAGNLLDADDLAGYLPKPSAGGEIVHVTYGLDAIEAVVIGGRCLTVA